MPRLENPRWEKFCEAYVRGETAGNAAASYEAAGFKGDRRDAAKLRQRSDISRRIDELQAELSGIETAATAAALKQLKITKVAVLSELAKLAFCNMLDYLRITPDGQVMVDFSRLDRDKAAAVKEVVIDTYLEGRGNNARTVERIRFTLADKNAALVSIGRHLGMFVNVVSSPDEPAALKKAVDAPPPETYEQWLERRNRELDGMGKAN
jgi:phage terminase small subunit